MPICNCSDAAGFYGNTAEQFDIILLELEVKNILATEVLLIFKVVGAMLVNNHYPVEAWGMVVVLLRTKI